MFSAEQVGIRMGGRQLLREVSFALAPGEVVCLLGNNGTGKSSLMKVCAGVCPPESGNLLFNGRLLQDISPRERARLIAWCPQSIPRVEHFSVAQFAGLAFQAERFWTGRSEFTADETALLQSCLEQFDVAHLANRDLTFLSGGEWTRVQLARVWAQKAAFVMLDEPNTGLDLRHLSVLAAACRKEASERGVAILLSTHDLLFALSVANRVIFIEDGRVKVDAKVSELVGSRIFADVFGVPFSWTEDPSGGVRVIPWV